MDYSKSGGARPDKNSPRHSEHNAKGSAQNPYGRGAAKADLIARMKAASEARKGEARKGEAGKGEAGKGES